MKRIPLTRGKFTLVDDEDFEGLSCFNWQAMKCRSTFYAVRTAPTVGGKPKTILMHRALCSGPLDVDHKNGDGLDNQKENLRQATNRQNQGNARNRSDNTSGYKGVYWSEQNKLWQAQIEFLGKHKHLGCFSSKVAAAKAYDAAAKEIFGEFSRLNFPAKV